jgi:hypothetical protein
MDEKPNTKVEAALTEADGLLRRQLADGELEDIEYFMLAIGPDGAAVIRGNCGPDALRAIAVVLEEIAKEVEADRGVGPH